jgi:hypothetical protein
MVSIILVWLCVEFVDRTRPGVSVGPEEMTSALESSVEELVVTSERPTVVSMAELVSPGMLVRVGAWVQEEDI